MYRSPSSDKMSWELPEMPVMRYGTTDCMYLYAKSPDYQILEWIITGHGAEESEGA